MSFDVVGHPVLIALGLLGLYAVSLVVQRLYLSPIRQFPGPKLAALTFWYEFYYDVICKGQYTFEIERMHKNYGPIIRINPAELHVETPDFYEKLYGGNRRDKWDWIVNQFGIPEATFSTVSADLHRIRRSALNPFFSMTSVRRLQPLIQEKVDILLKRLREFQESGEHVNIAHAFSAYTNDVVEEYAFGRSDHRLEAPDFDPSFHDASVAGTSMGHLIKQMPWILSLMTSLPDKLTVKMDPNMASYVKLQRDVRRQVAETQAGADGIADKTSTHPTIFQEIMRSNLPAQEKSFARLAQDGQVTVVAGTLTTAWTLAVAVVHLLQAPEILRKLRVELKNAIPDASVTEPLPVMEQLPYLTACIQEALRLSYGVSCRLQRIATDETLVFNDGKKNWKIPSGTPVGMTSTLIHHNESIFPNSKIYRPERWLENPRLDKYMVSFTKGARQCLGINLAYAEMYSMLAGLFRVYGSAAIRDEDDAGYLELFETTTRDIEIVHDMTIPIPASDSKGVRMRVLK